MRTRVFDEIRNVPVYASTAISVVLPWTTSVALNYVIFYAQKSTIHTLNVNLVTRHLDRKPTSDNGNYDNGPASSPQKNYRSNSQIFTSCVIIHSDSGDSSTIIVIRNVGPLARSDRLNRQIVRSEIHGYENTWLSDSRKWPKSSSVV